MRPSMASRANPRGYDNGEEKETKDIAESAEQVKKYINIVKTSEINKQNVMMYDIGKKSNYILSLL